MRIINRNYKLLCDFNKVFTFLVDIYNTETLNSYLLSQFYEHAHTSPKFNYKLSPRFGLWEDNDNLVGIACYEMDLGECFVCTKNGYDMLLPEMIEYSERNLSAVIENKNYLSIWVAEKERTKKEILEKMGYKKHETLPVTIFSYNKPFPNRILPKGFSIISLNDENDIKKVHACLWKGFDRGSDVKNEPGFIYNVDGRILMQSGPTFRKDLTTIIKDPKGEYVCYAGMRIDDKNNYAYLEPLATIPEYRRMGLATIALTEAMKKTKGLGAKYCFGGTREFYFSIGFETFTNIEIWKKEW
jgi:predicted N-acetyltransferase YhbS